MPQKEIYLRFIAIEKDERTESNKGLFTIAYSLSRDVTIPDYEQEVIKTLLVWFETNLRRPAKFSRKKNVGNTATKGLSWIKSSSKEVVRKLYELKSAVEHHHIHCKIIKSERPGYIVYEDEHQVVAEPFVRELK